jgi:hypothetical protein
MHSLDLERGSRISESNFRIAGAERLDDKAKARVFSIGLSFLNSERHRNTVDHPEAKGFRGG